jgi:Peptidase M15
MRNFIRILCLALLFCGGTVETANAMGGKASGLSPRLRSLIYLIEQHFHRPVKITSGCRSHTHNRRIGGARESWHLRCMAADIEILNVSKMNVAHYAALLPGRGGIGTYCHDGSVHVDLGPRREWYWGCGGQRNFHQGNLHRTTYRKHHRKNRHHKRRH